MHVASDVIERDGVRSEPFAPQKLRNSIYHACLSVRDCEGSAATAADAVSTIVTSWLTNKPEITSTDLRRTASSTLTKFNPAAAYYYAQHRNIL